MKIDDIEIEDTFAEAFRMHYARIVVTAADDYWLDAAVREFTGYGASVIGCDVEAGVERRLAPDETPDGRPGAAVLLFGMSSEKLATSVPRRAGQCLMTCATTAVYDGLPTADNRIPLGNHIRFFGDGFQKSKVIAGRRYWRVPVFDGEFLVEATSGTAKGIGGGSMIVQASTHEVALAAARASVEILADMPGVITPFPGGVIRSGSKVGSRYRGVVASTNEAYCPTLRSRSTTLLHPQAVCAYELVIDGIDEPTVAEAMARSIRAALLPGVLTIGAANYGGNLGKFHFRLHEVLRVSGIRLSWKMRPPGTIDAAPLRPDVLCGMPADELARVRLLAGRVWHELGELFHIEPLAADDPPQLELEGHEPMVRLAAGMTTGTLVVEGPAGLLAAAGLCGGRVEIRGDAGDLAGAAMRGGELVVCGSVGEMLAGPLPGTLDGMQGGEIVVLGAAGPRAGLRQRRGLIAVAGGVGPYAGHHLRAGTIVVAGGSPLLPGVGMQRGTIICLDGPVQPPPSFGLDGRGRPHFWRLLSRRLRELPGISRGVSPTRSGILVLQRRPARAGTGGNP